MDIEAESAPLVSSRPDVNASGLASAHTVHLDTASVRTGMAAGPGLRAVFELEEDESAALVGGHEPHDAAQLRVSESATTQESMPFWVIPLLVAAVRGVTSQLHSGKSVTRTHLARPAHTFRSVV